VQACDLPRVPSRRAPGAFRIQRVRLPAKCFPELRTATAFARAVLAGLPPGRCPVLNVTAAAHPSGFRLRIWQALRKIARGRTVTYGELARRAGRPRAARAAGGACGANPLPLFIPCHRVVAAGGRLGGFSSDPAWKQLLLAREGSWP
jgi:O-6-methylguanine DNA methyltransferase